LDFGWHMNLSYFENAKLDTFKLDQIHGLGMWDFIKYGQWTFLLS